MYTKKRNMKMYQFGGTIGASRYPKFWKFSSVVTKVDEMKFSILPRPVVKSRPGQFGHTMLHHTSWINKLIGDISDKVVEFLLAFDTSMNRDRFEVVTQVIHLIPSFLRIYDSMFT